MCYLELLLHLGYEDYDSDPEHAAATSFYGVLSSRMRLTCSAPSSIYTQLAVSVDKKDFKGLGFANLVSVTLEAVKTIFKSAYLRIANESTTIHQAILRECLAYECVS